MNEGCRGEMGRGAGDEIRFDEPKEKSGKK